MAVEQSDPKACDIARDGRRLHCAGQIMASESQGCGVRAVVRADGDWGPGRRSPHRKTYDCY
eukprot:11666581-Alexandrium_andersonii.AAC.1